jgi:aryl-alcohol dehydrogenase-like predicted oxidoreductase
MQSRRIGDVQVSAIGLGGMPMSIEGRPLGGIGRAAELGGRGAAFAEVAKRHGVSPQRVCLAWELAKSPVVVPIPGASRPESVQDSVRAAELTLTAEDLATLG